MGRLFEDGALLRKVAISGGPPITLASIGGGGGLRGATWMPDDTIIFATASPATGLQFVCRPPGDAGGADAA